MSWWLFLPDWATYPLFHLAIPFTVKQTSLVQRSDQSLKELFPSTGNIKGNEFRYPEARNKLEKNTQCLTFLKENLKQTNK